MTPKFLLSPRLAMRYWKSKVSHHLCHKRAHRCKSALTIGSLATQRVPISVLASGCIALWYKVHVGAPDACQVTGRGTVQRQLRDSELELERGTHCSHRCRCGTRTRTCQRYRQPLHLPGARMPPGWFERLPTRLVGLDGRVNVSLRKVPASVRDFKRVLYVLMDPLYLFKAVFSSSYMT